MLVFIFIFPTTQPALWRCNHPSKPQEMEGEEEGGGERERGRKSTHTVLFLLVCKQCSTHGLYVYSVCVRVCLCVRALFSAHS